MLGQFFLEMTATDTAYVTMPDDSIMPCINILSSDEDSYCRHDGAPTHYHIGMRNYLNVLFPGRWIGQRESVEYPPRSPELTPLDFVCVGYCKEYFVH
jgi:hypothetical protein